MPRHRSLNLRKFLGSILEPLTKEYCKQKRGLSINAMIHIPGVIPMKRSKVVVGNEDGVKIDCGSILPGKV